MPPRIVATTKRPPARAGARVRRWPACTYDCEAPVAIRTPTSKLPATHLVDGEWPWGRIEGPFFVLQAAEFSARLADILQTHTLRQVADRCGVSASTVLSFRRGESWPDAFTVGQMERGLGPLWPGADLYTSTLLDGERCAVCSTPTQPLQLSPPRRQGRFQQAAVILCGPCHRRAVHDE